MYYSPDGGSDGGPIAERAGDAPARRNGEGRLQRILACFMEALEKERDAVRQTVRNIELKEGAREKFTGTVFLYAFPLEEPLIIREESRGNLILRGDESALRVEAVVASVSEKKLVIAVEEDLGEHVPAALLQLDSTFLITALVKRFRQIASASPKDRANPQEKGVPFHAGTLWKLLNPDLAATGSEEPHPQVFADGKMNEEQREAVRRSLGSDLLFLWGPPGTGKTVALARIVEAHYRAGRSVLLLSNTNAAVDTALERIAERVEGEELFDKGLVLRFGVPVRRTLIDRFGDKVIFDNVLRKEAADAFAALDKANDEKKKLRERLDEIKKILGSAEFREVMSGIREAEAGLRETGARVEAARGALAKAMKKMAGHEAAEREAAGMDLVRRVIHGYTEGKLRRERERIEAEANAARDKLEKAKAAHAKTEKRLAELRKKAASFCSDGVSVGELEREKRDIAERISFLEDKIRKLREKIEEERKKILGRTRIAACTVYTSYLSRFPLRRFDVVVLDEASMLPFPHAVIGACRTSGKVVVTGDFRQIPPIVVSNDKIVRRVLGRDVFAVAKIPRKIENGEDLPYLVPLRTQYRMAEPLCRLVGDTFYTGLNLRTAPQVKERADDGFPLGGGHLFLLDTSSLAPWVAFPAYNGSRYNIIHALAVRNIVLQLDEAGFLPHGGGPNEALGIATPFNSQAEMINDALKAALGRRGAGLASTVHRFQGDEKDTIILDLTISKGAGPGRFFESSGPDSMCARLLNVAVSRARRRLILVADLDYMYANCNRINPVALVLLERFRREAERLQPGKVLLPQPPGPQGLHKAAAEIYHGSSTFHSAFLSDIEGSEKSVLIVSPFISARRLSKWLEHLRAAAERGVEITVLTRPDYKAGVEEVPLDILRSIPGASLHFREGIHQKLAIVDERICWFGSLNILSFGNSEEIMMRIESEGIAASLAKRQATLADEEIVKQAGPYGNPPCPQCGGPMVLGWLDGKGRKGFKCPACGTSRRLRTRKNEGR